MRVADPSKAERLVAARGVNGAVRYIDAAGEHGEPCQYGHLGCAAKVNGACSDEVSALIDRADTE